jgi:hypothetical protein
MSTTCDRIACSRPASHRISGRPYCESCARSLAEGLQLRLGRPILDLAKHQTHARS